MGKTVSISENSQICLQYRDSIIHSKEEEERQSEQRIRFFLSLITGIAAFIGILLREKILSEYLLKISIISSSILFIFGILTFSRIIWSVGIVDNLEKAKVAMDKLIYELNPLIENSLIKENVRGTVHIKVLSHIKGTYAQYMYLIECLLAVSIVFLYGAIKPLPINCTVIIAIEIFFLVFLFLFSWSIIVRRGFK